MSAAFSVMKGPNQTAWIPGGSSTIREQGSKAGVHVWQDEQQDDIKDPWQELQGSDCVYKM